MGLPPQAAVLHRQLTWQPPPSAPSHGCRSLRVSPLTRRRLAAPAWSAALLSLTASSSGTNFSNGSEPAVLCPETSSHGGVRAAEALACPGEPELCVDALALLRELPWQSRARRRSSSPGRRAVASPEVQSLKLDERKARGPEPFLPERESPLAALAPSPGCPEPNASVPRPPSRPSRVSPSLRRIPGPRETRTSSP